MQNIFIELLPPWVETGLQPAFYDKESGTVLQQVSRMWAKMIELGKAFNDFSKDTSNTVNEYIAKFVELHDYVHDYFDNLDVQEEINNIKGVRQREKLLEVQCFGNFEVYANGEKLTFKRSKTKELFAFLIDRNGASVTSAEICVTLWENGDEQNKQNYIHQLFRDLRQALEGVGADAVFLRNNYTYSIVPEKIDCDYFSYLKTGNPKFRGEYMSQYSWAEETCGLLWRNTK